MTAVRELACDPTVRLWIKGHALSTSQLAIYSPYPLRLMTWTIEVEIMQIAFPWKSPSLFLSSVRCELACWCTGFVFIVCGRVSESDGSAVKVRGETAFS